jgi:hypothetical protein
VKLEIPNIDHFVEVNGLRPVTDPIFMEADGGATAGGLFSSEIFGRPGSEDRRERWAYVDLGGTFLHPLVYKTCTQLERAFPEILSGTRGFRVGPRGELLLAEPGEEEDGVLTGVAGLQSAWDRISWGQARPGGQREQRTGLLEAVPAELAFITKWPVMPALFRDIDVGSAGGNVKEIPPVNYLYVQLMTTAPSRVSGFDFADGARKKRAQDVLVELHQSCLALIAGKSGLIQDRILGKYADWAIQGVISGPALSKAESPGSQEVPFGSLGVPLYLAVNLFQPFFLKSLDERLRALAHGQERILLPGGDHLELPREAREQLNVDTYRHWVGRFMRSQTDRSAPLSVATGKGEEVLVPLYDAQLGRPTTLTDLFYIAAVAVVQGKHVMFTRYPIEDFRAPHFASVSILTTEKTQALAVGGTNYPSYPVLGPGEPRWVDSIRLNNSYTPAMGADFDGDRIRILGLFTQEANAEAARLIRAPTNFVDGQGRPSRVVANEAILTLYSMTA